MENIFINSCSLMNWTWNHSEADASSGKSCYQMGCCNCIARHRHYCCSSDSTCPQMSLGRS